MSNLDPKIANFVGNLLESLMITQKFQIRNYSALVLFTDLLQDSYKNKRSYQILSEGSNSIPTNGFCHFES